MEYTVNSDLVSHGSLTENLGFLQSYIEKLRKDFTRCSPPPTLLQLLYLLT